LVNNASDKLLLKQAYLNNYRYYTDFIEVYGCVRRKSYKKEYGNLLKKFQFDKEPNGEYTYVFLINGSPQERGITS
jgi:hypothetical protein